MNVEEARTVLQIMRTADFDCSSCARELFKQFNNSFPGFEDIARQVWAEQFVLGELDD